MRRSYLLKKGLVVLISLSMSLGPCAPGSFSVLAETGDAVSSGQEHASEEILNVKSAHLFFLLKNSPDQGHSYKILRILTNFDFRLNSFGQYDTRR